MSFFFFRLPTIIISTIEDFMKRKAGVSEGVEISTPPNPTFIEYVPEYGPFIVSPPYYQLDRYIEISRQANWRALIFTEENNSPLN